MAAFEAGVVLVGQNFGAKPITEVRGFNWSTKLPQLPAIGGQRQSSRFVCAQRCLSNLIMLYVVLEK